MSRHHPRHPSRYLPRRPLLLAGVAAAAAVLVILTLAPLGAQPSPHAHVSAVSSTGPHAACPHAGHAGVPPRGAGAAPVEEIGQDTFAALQEIVRELDADPATDWESVSIRTLREHLVDMDRVLLSSEVVEEPVTGGIRARIRPRRALDERTRDAIHRMVPAHAAQLAADGWEVRVERESEGVTLTVRVGTQFGPEGTDTRPDPRAVSRLRGLGFFGLLTLGDHHGPHHRHMATGSMAH